MYRRRHRGTAPDCCLAPSKTSRCPPRRLEAGRGLYLRGVFVDAVSLAGACVLAVSGLVKIAGPASTRIALALVGLPATVLVARLLGAAEIALAVAAIGLGGTAALAAVGVTYFMFAVVASVLWRRGGGAADCGCFGRAGSPASPLHVALNVLLGAASVLASFGLWADGEGPDGSSGSAHLGIVDAAARSRLADLAFVAVVAAITVLIVMIFTQGPALLGSHRAAVAPRRRFAGASSGDDADETSPLLDEVLRDAGDVDVVLVFLSSTCITCLGFWDELRDLRRGDAAELGIVVVTHGPEREDRRTVDKLAPRHLQIVMSSRAFERYSVPGAPYLVRVEAISGNVIAEATANDWPSALGLVKRSPQPPGPRTKR